MIEEIEVLVQKSAYLSQMVDKPDFYKGTIFSWYLKIHA